ncbi:uncharacterized protein [Onthophagus taurus]|uniref:uncharacterized protein n=1 Tax=Onthophagus taurus TaxID=166361 RepID=UPI0039BE3A8D
MPPAYALTLLLLVLTSSGAIDEDFAFDLSDEIGTPIPVQNLNKKFLPTTTAVVGRVFHYQIPVDVFKEETIKLKAKLDGYQSLPSWLLFGKSAGVFWGVPTEEDIGEHHVVVKAYKKNDIVTYEFILIVHDGENYEECSTSDDLTVLKIKIAKELKTINPKQRVTSVMNIAKFLGLPDSAFKIKSSLESNENANVFMIGPGNVKSRNLKASTIIKVVVGCNGRLWNKTTKIIHSLKPQCVDGTVEEVLGLPVTGWELLKEKSDYRSKRQIENGSGDDLTNSGDGDGEDDYVYENYDYEEYLDNNDDLETPVLSFPVGTTTPRTTTTEKLTTTTPSTTTTTTSSTSTGASTVTEEITEVHPHRHHHGESMSPISEKKTTVSIQTSRETNVFTTTEKDDFDNYDYDIDDEDDDIESETIIPVNKPKLDSSNKKITKVDEDNLEYTPASESTTMNEKITETMSETTVSVLPKKSTTIIDEEDDDKTKIEVTSYIDNEVTSTTEIEKEIITSPTTTTSTTTSSTTTTTLPPSTTTTTTTSTTILPPILLTTNSTESQTTPITSTTETLLKLSTTTESANINTTLSEVVESTTQLGPSTEETNDTQEETVVKQTTLRHITTTQKPTSRVTTETIIYEVRNFPPTLQNRLNRVAATAGKAFNFTIPEDTFSDLEDGTNLKLEFLDAEGRPVDKYSWCQFRQEAREIYGLPMEDNVSRWTYTIRATDSEGASVSDHLEISVQHHKSRRAVNHEFSLYVQLEKKYQFPYQIEWPLRILNSLKEIYRLPNLNDITVRNVDHHSVPAVFTWTNDSLPKHICPKKELDSIFKVLTINHDGDPTHELITALSPALKVKKVAYKGLGVCEPKQPPPAPMTPPTNFSPVLRNPVDHINATVGKLLVFKVPDDTFYDPEDTDPRNLRMKLLTSDRQPLPFDNWLQFDDKNKEFYGIPMINDTGSREYQLICKDSGGLSASDSLVVVVHPAPRYHYNVEFRMSLVTEYEKFVHSAGVKRKFVEKLQELFEDKTTDHIQLKSISRGSTIISWYNTSLRLDQCPRDEIKRLGSMLVNTDRTIASRVQYIMDDDFPVKSIQLEDLGACKRQSIQVPKLDTTPPPPVDEGGSSSNSYQDEYLVTFIVPAIIITAMLLLAGVFACILYRRRRSGKMNVDDEGRATYGNKGIPVIFQEELEDKPESGTKTPIIFKDEKPPLAPPEYSKSGSLKLTDDSEPYQPPPPVARVQENGRQLRPKPTPTYRKPPPYVPP